MKKEYCDKLNIINLKRNLKRFSCIKFNLLMGYDKYNVLKACEKCKRLSGQGLSPDLIRMRL